MAYFIGVVGIDKKIQLIIDNNAIDRYAEYYFSLHKKAHKNPIPYPYHESINTWMIMRRPMMNALKQRWKDFVQWLISEQGYDNLRIDRCEIHQKVFYPTRRRRDIDNSVPKFILDGLVESGMIIDDSYNHIVKLVLECGFDKDNPRTEIIISVLDEDTSTINKNIDE